MAAKPRRGDDIAKISYANNTIVLNRDLRIRRKLKFKRIFYINMRYDCPSLKLYERSRLEFRKNCKFIDARII